MNNADTKNALRKRFTSVKNAVEELHFPRFETERRPKADAKLPRREIFHKRFFQNILTGVFRDGVAEIFGILF